MYIPNQAGGGFSAKNVGDHGFGGPPAIHFAGETNSDMADGALKPDAPKEQLYNLRTDLSQSTNVIREHPEIAQAMKKRLAEIRAAKGTR
jgi:hypothetical protein